MTRRESRGLMVLIITLVALISGGIIAYKTKIYPADIEFHLYDERAGDEDPMLVNY